MRGKTCSAVAFGALLIVGGACTSSGDDDDSGTGTPMGGSTTPTGGSTAPMGGSTAPMGGSVATGGKGGTTSAGSGGTVAAGSSAGGMSGGGAGTTEPPPDTDCAPRGGDPAGMCASSASGVFAIKTVVDVWWQDDASPPLVDPGRDTITVYLLGKMSGVCKDGKGTGVMKGCGTVLPPFKSDANCDVFSIEFPDEIWDSDKMPTFMTTGMTDGFEPGSVLDIATATGLVGIDLMDPDTKMWPQPSETGTFACAAGKGAQCFPDHDGDGKPGITIRMGKIGTVLSKGNCGGFMLDFVFRGAPLDALSALDDDSVRADKLQIGVRTRIGGGGTIGADCKSGVGDSTAEFLDSRVLDCSKTDGSACMPDEAAFVDEQAPTYNILKKGTAPPTTVTVPATQGGGPLDQKPSVGPRSALVRLGDLGENFTCADVRNAAYPAL